MTASRTTRTCLVLAALVAILVVGVVVAQPGAQPARADEPPPAAWRFEFRHQWSHQPPVGVFNWMLATAFNQTGNLYVVDFYNHRVQVLDREGQAIRAFGHLGSGPGELYLPQRVAVDAAGVVYVTDLGLHRVARFAPDGSPLPPWEGFERPYGISIGSDGSVYVSDNPGLPDTLHGRIHKLSPDGTSRTLVVQADIPLFLLKVKREGVGDVIYTLARTGSFGGDVRRYSADGMQVGQYTDPELRTVVDAEVDSEGTLYIVDQYADAIIVDGWRGRQRIHERWFGVVNPVSIALGPDNLLYVTDGRIGQYGEPNRSTQMRINRFTLTGQRVEPTWGSDEGHEPGQFNLPDRIAWDPAGYVWVHNNGDGRFMQFTPEGTFVRETPRRGELKGIHGLAVDRDGNLLLGQLCSIIKLSPAGDVLYEYQGSTPRCIDLSIDPDINFTTPFHIEPDSAGNMYVTDFFNHRVVKLNRDGQRQKVYGGPDSLGEAHGSALDEAHDRLYVLDWREVMVGGLRTSSTRIQVYRISDGALVDTWIVPNSEPGRTLEDAWVGHIEVDRDGYVYASDVGTQTIWKLDPVKGDLVARIEPGGYGAGPGKFNQLAELDGFALDPQGNLYAVDGFMNQRVQVFAQVSSPVAATATPTPATTESPTPTSSPTATLTASATSTATSEPTGTAAPLPTPSATDAVTPTVTPTATTSMAPSSTVTPTLPIASTETPTATPTSPPATLTPTPTRTATVTGTALARDYKLFLPYLMR